MGDFTHLLRDLVAAVDAAWDGRPGTLPQVASQALGAARLHRHLTVDSVTDALAGWEGLPPQLDPSSAFGDPPLTLAVAKGFHIDAYFWVNPATGIHDHGFEGAYTILEGVSLHTRFRFQADPARAGDGVAGGTLEVAHAEVLRPGAVREIHAGPSFIHQSAHLTLPSLTLAVRTTERLEAVHQQDYLHPGLALPAPHHLGELERRRLEVMLMLLRARRERGVALATALYRGASDRFAAWILCTVARSALEVGLARTLAESYPRPFAHDVVFACERANEAMVDLGMAQSEPDRLERLLEQNRTPPALREALRRAYAEHPGR